MKKIIIIGKNSFIGKNLFSLLKNNLLIKKLSYEEFISLKKISNVDYIINCTSNIHYVKKPYKAKNDFDYQVALKIKDLKTKLVFLSSRKVYKPNQAIKESGKLYLSSNYAKNKILTEKKLKKILNNKVLVLRISNIIGPINNHKTDKTLKRKIHTTFIDHFFSNVKKGLIFENNRNYKDFISIKKLSEIVLKLITKNIVGTFNISMGKRVYLSLLVEWLNFHNKRYLDCIDLPVEYNKECFYLNNNKLKKTINIIITLKELENYCKNLSMKYFKKNK